MSDFSDAPWAKPPVAAELGRRLHQVARKMNRIIADQHFPRPFSSLIKEALTEPGKLFSSQAAKGYPIVGEDRSLWALAVLLAHATASQTGKPNAPLSSWNAVIPTAAAAEFLGVALDLIDDIQDGDGMFVGRVGIPLSLNIALTLLELVHLSLDDARYPESIRGPLHSMYTSAILAATGGQFLDIAYESRNSVTVQDVLHMTALKSGTLMSLLYQAGAFVGAHAKNDLEHAIMMGNDFARFGHIIGIIAQLNNDTNDALATAAPKKSDRQRGKKTVPLVFEAELIATGHISSDDTAEAMLRFTGYTADMYRIQALECLDQLVTSYGIPAASLRWLLKEREASS